jgi:hypothetical protein
VTNDHTTNKRFQQIEEAYTAALGDDDAASVDILDLLPAIFEAVPDTNTDEIAAALRRAAEQQFKEADALERYHKARRK